MNAKELTPSASEKLIYERLIGSGFPDQFSKLVTAQSGHETNGWTSNVYMTNNNAFGYGYTGSGYRVYSDVENSVDEIIDYVWRRVDGGEWPPVEQITDEGTYAQLLKGSGYYSDSETTYANGISRWFNTNLATIAVSGGLLIFAALAYFLLRN